MKAAEPVPITRPERLGRLGDFCAATAASLRRMERSPDQIFIVFRDLIACDCERCHTRVAGEELFVLAQPHESPDLDTRLRRLRLGFCAKADCQSFHCRLTFKPGAGVEWAACLALVERALQDLEDSRSGRGRRWRKELIRPLLLAAIGVMVLLLARQLYYGGRIPLLREPEKFRVDPEPHESRAH